MKEDEAFSPSYDLAPSESPLPLPLPSVSSTGQRQLADGRGEEGVGEDKSYDYEKAWSSVVHEIMYSLFSAQQAGGVDCHISNN
jgi:hypothetical protein